MLAHLIERLKIRKILKSLRRFSTNPSHTDLLHLDTASLENMKLPFDLANAARRERVLHRPFRIHDPER